MQRYFFNTYLPPEKKAPAMTEHESLDVHKSAFADAEACEAPGLHRTFILKRNPANQGPLRFAVFGCQGDGQNGARAVGDAINLYCEVNNKPLDFVILAGDNCYPNGMEKATDPLMLKSFNEPFPDKHVNLRVPYFAIAGNHCENRQKESAKQLNRYTQPGRAKADAGIPRLLNMMAYTFVSYEKNKFQYRPSNSRYYNQFHDNDQKAGGRHIELAVLTQNKIYFNMPRRYYSLQVEEEDKLLDVEILMLDSNTFAEDCLQYFRSNKTLSADNNQVAWALHRLKAAYSAKRKVILVQHHPLFVLGKIREDILYYMSEKDKNELISLLKQKIPALKDTPIKSQNALLYYCMLALEIAFDRDSHSELVIDLVLTAHDHNFYYVNNKGHAPQPFPIPCQITAGTGGGELQDQYIFEPKAAIGTFLKKTGFVLMSYTHQSPDFEFAFYSADDKYILYFDTSGAQPLQKHNSSYDENALNELNRISQLFFVIRKGIDEYLDFIANRQSQANHKFFSSNSAHGVDGVTRANELLAYMNDVRPKINYKAVTSAVMEHFARNAFVAVVVTDREHSLITLINNEMLHAYKQTLEEHHQKPTLMNQAYMAKVGIKQEQKNRRTDLN